MSDAPLIERIRVMLLQAAPSRSDVQALAQQHAEQVQLANALLGRCHAWSQRGLGSEAFSLGESRHIARHAAHLRLDGSLEAWQRLLQSAGVGGVAQIDVVLLESYVAMAGRQQALAPQLAAMRVAALSRAPMPQRLATLHALFDRDPRQPAWLDAIRQLEREATALLAEAAREAVRDANIPAACEVTLLFDTMKLRLDEHRDVFEKVRAIAEADRSLAAQVQANEILHSLHAAAAAMDMVALQQWAQAWNTHAAEHAPSNALRREAEGPLDLLLRDRERAQREQQRSAIVRKLELALDQSADMIELERLADATVRADASLPAPVALRLQARRVHAAAASARRRGLIIFASILLASMIGTGGWFCFQWYSSEQRLQHAIAQVNQSIEAHDFASANKALDSIGATESAHASRAEVAVARQHLADAQARLVVEQAASQAMLAEAETVLARQDTDALALESRSRELTAAVDRQPRALQENFRQLATRLQSAAAERRDRGLDDSRASQRAIEGQLAAVIDPSTREAIKFNQAAWIAAADAYGEVTRAAREAAVQASAHRDAQAIAESMQATATLAASKELQARERAGRIERVIAALAQLEIPSVDEEATLESWRKLLQDGGDVLADRGMLRSCEAGFEAAKSGMAIRAWRIVVIPSLIAGRGDLNQPIYALDWGDPVVARTLDASMTRHLDEQATTPYHETAESLRALARRTLAATGTATSLADAAALQLQATGYGALLEQGYTGGRTLYARRVIGKKDALGQAIDTRQDLARDPSALVARKPPAFQRVAGERAWPSSKAVDNALNSLKALTGRQARDQWLRMLVEIRAAEVSDPVLQWHAMHDLWNIWLKLFADERDSDDAAAAKWVRSLDGVSALSGEDPILIAASESSGRIDGIRRLAREQLATCFDASRLLAAAARRDKQLSADTRAAAPLGLAKPLDIDHLQVLGMKIGDQGVVPSPGAQGWHLVPLQVEKLHNRAQVKWRDAPPGTPISWPQIIFVQGENQ